MRHTKQIFAGLFSRIARNINYRSQIEDYIDIAEQKDLCPFNIDCDPETIKRSCENYENCRIYKFYQRYGKDWRELGI